MTGYININKGSKWEKNEEKYFPIFWRQLEVFCKPCLMQRLEVSSKQWLALATCTIFSPCWQVNGSAWLISTAVIEAARIFRGQQQLQKHLMVFHEQWHLGCLRSERRRSGEHSEAVKRDAGVGAEVCLLPFYRTSVCYVVPQRKRGHLRGACGWVWSQLMTLLSLLETSGTASYLRERLRVRNVCWRPFPTTEAR